MIFFFPSTSATGLLATATEAQGCLTACVSENAAAAAAVIAHRAHAHKLLVTSSARHRCRRNTAEYVNTLPPLENHFHSLSNLELFANAALQRAYMQGSSISA